MKISIYGAGYVGLVTGACLADIGNEVVCVDIDEDRVKALNDGESFIYEPGLDSLIKSCCESGQLRFTTDVAAAVKHGIIQFIAVGTPSAEDGSANLEFVLEVAKNIGTHITEYSVVVDKSTVPVGTADQVKATIERVLKNRGAPVKFSIAANPEFLREGNALSDFTRPDRIVIGTDDFEAEQLLRELYAPFNTNHDRLLAMDLRSAELTKYAANAMLATKISFMNEMANIAENVGADIEQVRLGIGSDSRIGFSYIHAGCGYGGSCFPKDVRAVAQTAHAHGYEPRILLAVDAVNEAQKEVLFTKIKNRLGDLSEKTIAIWGLSFKPNTDDMREACSLVLIKSLLEAGSNVRVNDPKAMKAAEKIIDSPNIQFCDNPYETLKGCDALAILTEWESYQCPDFRKIKTMLREPLIFDGRNLYKPETVQEAELEYHSIGRPAACQRNALLQMQTKRSER